MNLPTKIDVAVIGAGPVGIETAIALQESGVETLLFEARQIGHSISNWPPDTHFFSPPERVSLAGVPVHNRDQLAVTGEEYLPYLRMLVEQFDLRLHNYEPVLSVERVDGGFILHTRSRNGDHTYHCRYIVAAIGGNSSPRKLGIPGEALGHVHHRFQGPHPYFRARVLVLGGRNSALETALRCWRAGAQVAISYRRPVFDPNVTKRHLLDDITTRIDRGEITFLSSTTPVEITSEHVLLAPTGERAWPDGSHMKQVTDFVLVLVGFATDTRLLAQAGVEIDAAAQSPVHNPNTMETNLPGFFVAGTAVGGTDWRVKHAIYTSHNHVARIVKAITGQVPKRLGAVESRNKDISWEEISAS